MFLCEVTITDIIRVMIRVCIAAFLALGWSDLPIHRDMEEEAPALIPLPRPIRIIKNWGNEPDSSEFIRSQPCNPDRIYSIIT